MMRESECEESRHRVRIGLWTNTVAAKRLVALAFALALALVALSTTTPPAPALDPAPRLPDLRMGEIQDLRIREQPDGRRLLRFTAIMVNVGAGPFELYGERASTSSLMTVTQRIYNEAGGYRDVSTSAKMFYSGDGHDHWHVKDLQRYSLKKRGGDHVGEGAKEGFCFFDNFLWNGALPGSPKRKHFDAGSMCGEAEEKEALEAKMGVSVGWSDVYQYYLPGQWIDISNLRSGRYRLRAVADVNHMFRESREANNYTWVDIELRGNRVKVINYGPSARYCGPNGRYC